MPQPKIFSLIDKIIFDYEMIKDGDKILIAASGGKDSTVLVEYFSKRARRKNCNFEYKALHIESEITKPIDPELVKKMEEWNVPLENLFVDILARVKPNQKMNCFWCATQRRTELLNYAIKNGFNKIALGHHMDDALETLLMNMTEKSELSTMPPFLKYEKYPVSIIRPLLYVPEEKIISHAKEAGYICHTCTCNYQDNSLRKQIRAKLEALCDTPEKKEHMFYSLKNVQKEYLL
ncbi:MAG: tRNA 2-thiocytidine biosynthesis protein TtcA [Treponema sp.]|nr:tRNA 2-thiocytidine biosynthesis protein TtcA [Candidatus Treponema merdequi]